LTTTIWAHSPMGLPIACTKAKPPFQKQLQLSRSSTHIAPPNNT
jgi:hypothetical protein